MDLHRLFRIFRRVDVQLCLGSILFFLVFPRFDVQVSRLFVSEVTGRFVLADNVYADFVYWSVHAVALAVLVVLTVLVAASAVKRHSALGRHSRALIFLLIAGLMGPGLMVNTVLKEHWGRYRPNDVVEFGGTAEFQPPFPPQPDAECRHCTSFVSGHASVGFYFMSFALLAGRRRWLWLPITAGAAIGAVRIAQGQHFFSDVLFSGWVVWFCSILLHRFLLQRREVTEAGLGSRAASRYSGAREPLTNSLANLRALRRDGAGSEAAHPR